MISKNLKITVREISKDKIYAGIKIVGFAIGLVACFLIALYIKHEMSYDKHYKYTDRIYRVLQVRNTDGSISRGTFLPSPFACALVKEFPEIEIAGRLNAVELYGAGKNLVRVAGTRQNVDEPGFVYADQAAVEVLELPFISGDPDHALEEPQTILITKKIAEKYFPNQEAIGKSLIINNNADYPFRITGVIENFPENSHLDYNFLIGRYENIFGTYEENTWNYYNYDVYVRVKKGTNISLLEEKLDFITTQYIIPDIVETSGNQNFNDLVRTLSFELQPIKDIHLKSSDVIDNQIHGDIRMVWLFSALAIFILIIACINFINLSTAKSIKRSREVGLKKTIGASRKNIIGQFLSESVIYSLLAVCIGVILTVLFLPLFNWFSGKTLSIPWNEWWLYPLLMATVLGLGFLAGLYPSFYLSRFKPVAILKGTGPKHKNGLDLRSGLVVFQFITTIVLIIVTLTINKQINYILNKKLGYEKDQVILLHGTNSLDNKIRIFKEELLKIPQVQSASISDYLPVRGTLRNGNMFFRDGYETINEGLSGQRWIVDADYVKTLGMNILEGRDFSEDISSDRNAAIINESMAEGLNLVNPVGERITNGGQTWNVIGIIEDFHTEHLRNEIAPVCLILGESPKYISVRASTSDMQQLIHNIDKLWSEFSPDQAFQYSFLDADFAIMYKDVERTSDIFLSFAVLAIIVACLGLFGLAEYTTKERTKEIGVRKVNGAKIKEILMLLNIKFIRWIILAFIIASPLAWYATNLWLQNFAYHTSITWWIFALAGLLALGIAILTVSWQSWRAATRNPVEALRYE